MFSDLVKLGALAALFHAVDVRASYTFLSIGDWGGHALEKTQYKDNVDDVAKQMAKTVRMITSFPHLYVREETLTAETKRKASATGAHFVVNTGDNFYWSVSSHCRSLPTPRVCFDRKHR